MRPGAAAVEQEIRVHAAGFLQRIGEDRHALECAVGVDRRRDGDSGGCEPCGIGDDGTEGIAEDVAEETALNKFLCHIRRHRTAADCLKHILTCSMNGCQRAIKMPSELFYSTTYTVVCKGIAFSFNFSFNNNLIHLLSE